MGEEADELDIKAASEGGGLSSASASSTNLAALMGGGPIAPKPLDAAAAAAANAPPRLSLNAWKYYESKLVVPGPKSMRFVWSSLGTMTSSKASIWWVGGGAVGHHEQQQGVRMVWVCGGPMRLGACRACEGCGSPWPDQQVLHVLGMAAWAKEVSAGHGIRMPVVGMDSGPVRIRSHALHGLFAL